LFLESSTAFYLITYHLTTTEDTSTPPGNLGWRVAGRSGPRTIAQPSLASGRDSRGFLTCQTRV